LFVFWKHFGENVELKSFQISGFGVVFENLRTELENIML